MKFWIIEVPDVDEGGSPLAALLAALLILGLGVLIAVIKVTGRAFSAVIDHGFSYMLDNKILLCMMIILVVANLILLFATKSGLFIIPLVVLPPLELFLFFLTAFFREQTLLGSTVIAYALPISCIIIPIIAYLLTSDNGIAGLAAFFFLPAFFFTGYGALASEEIVSYSPAEKSGVSPSELISSNKMAVDKKKAKEMFDSWYTSDYDFFVGQEYEGYADEASVIFGKDGLAFGKFMYYLDKDTDGNNVITVEPKKEKNKWSFKYFKDGSVVYNAKESLVYYKTNASFNAQNASEVIGRTFSGSWHGKDASITFLKNGKAKLTIGDKSEECRYLASNADNMVAYIVNGNANAFYYEDDSDRVVNRYRYVDEHAEMTLSAIWTKK
ncbi:MAG: hypothetical protein K6G80_08425 [Treponema sp.]|nr:hypothetical protein [Treponema sp.]